jgi:hypothetical protein
MANPSGFDLVSVSVTILNKTSLIHLTCQWFVRINHCMETNIFSEVYDNTTPPDLLGFITHPYALERNIDPVSKLYQVMQATRSSPAIAVFYLFALMSYWNLRRGVTYRIPKDFRTHRPNLWLMALAPSGASKTQQVSLINSLLEDRKELRSSFSQPASPASLIEQFFHDNVQLWVEDEAAKYLAMVENPSHRLAPLKGHLLKIKGGDPLTYHSKKDGEQVIEKPLMTILFINTLAGMVNTISDESFVDGFFSRFGIVLSEVTPEISDSIKERFPSNLHDLRIVEESGIKEDLERMFSQEIDGKEYTFDGCVETYERAVDSLRASFSWMQGEHNIFKPFFERTVLESFKYAIFHHQLMNKPGTEIDSFDMEYGLRVARFTLCSLSRFQRIRLHGTPKAIINKKTKEMKLRDKIQRYVIRNPKATLRTIYRVHSLTKVECCKMLQELGMFEAVMQNKDVDDQLKLSLKKS